MSHEFRAREELSLTEELSTASAVGEGKSIPSGGGWATHVALVIVQIAFASQAVEAKIAMMPRADGGEEIAPSALAMVRMLGGALFFQLLARRIRGAQSATIGIRDHARLVGLSVLGISLNQTLFLMGLKWTTPFSAALLSAAIPVFAAGLAVLFGKEPFSWRTLFGIALGILGVFSLVGRGSLDRGALLVTLNGLSYATYVVLSRDVLVRVGALRSVAWIFTYGALLFAPLGTKALLWQLPMLTVRGWLFTAYIVAVPTVVAYFLHAWALARSSATVATIYIYLQPLFAALLAWVQLRQGISSRAAWAGLLILLGLGVVAFRRTPKRSALRST